MKKTREKGKIEVKIYIAFDYNADKNPSCTVAITTIKTLDCTISKADIMTIQLVDL